MSSTRSLYKAKPKGLGSRDVRATLKSQESRSGRDALLSSRRGIPLAAVQEEVPPKKKVTDPKSQPERLQKLREWQDKRNQAKEKEKLTSKRPFNYGGSRSSRNVLKTDSDRITVGKKSATIPKGNANNTKSCLGPDKRSEVKTRAAKDPVCRIPPKSTATTGSGMPPKPKKKTAAKEAPPTRASRRIAEQSREKDVNPSTTTSRHIADRSREKIVNSSTTKTRQPRVNGKTSANKSEKAPQVTRGTRRGKSAVVGGVSSATKSGKKRVKDTESSESTDTASSLSPPHTLTPHTPPAEHDHTPTHHTLTQPPAHNTLSSIPPSAWLPANQVVTRIRSVPSFEDTLGPCTFSPFKFTAGSNTGRGGAVAMATRGDDNRSKFKGTPGKGCLFTFRKAIDEGPVSMATGGAMMQSDVTTTDTSMSVDSLECEQPPAVSMAPKTMETQQTTEDPQVETSNCEGGIDFPYFRKLHDDVAEQLTAQCAQWRAKNEALEREMEEDGENGSHLEEAIDQIRTAIGQAELLITKKMKQYYKLVAEAVDDGGKTSAEDLQGFWDLVMIQVEDVQCKFESLGELERNGWKPPQMERKGGKKRGKKRAATVSSSSSTTAVSKRQTAARERREAMRSRLREMKREAAKRAEQQGEGEEGREEEAQEIETTVASPTRRPVTPSNGDSLSSHRGSCSKRKSTGKRRRSRRLRKRSSVALIDFSELSTGVELTSSTTPSSPPSTHNNTVFSPSQDTSPSSTVAGPHSEVPIAQLVSFNSPSGVTPIKSPPRGASVRRFVSVTPSKRLREMMTTVDVVMSPARRSLRIAERLGTTSGGSHGNYQVASLEDLPEELDVGYWPNKALL